MTDKINPSASNLYKQRSPSQEDFAKNKNSNPNPELSDFDLRASNPILLEQLQKKNNNPCNKVSKKSIPPKPRLNYRSAPINPRKVKPSIPGRLKGFFDNKIKQIDKLNQVLDALTIDQGQSLIASKKIDANLFEIITKKKHPALFSLPDGKLPQSYDAFADWLLGFEAEDSEILHYVEYLATELKQEASPKLFLPLVQMFLPLPLPYDLLQLDQKFEKEEEELKRDHQGFIQSAYDESDSEIFISVQTINFNSLSFCLRYISKSNSLQIILKADPVATELAIPIETNLEMDLANIAVELDFALSLWDRDSQESNASRKLKLDYRGELNEILLRACVSILTTIYENDRKDDSMIV